MPDEKIIPQSSGVTVETLTQAPPAERIEQSKAGINPALDMDSFESEFVNPSKKEKKAPEVPKTEEVQKTEGEVKEPESKEVKPDPAKPAKAPRLPDIEIPGIRKKDKDGKFTDTRDYSGLAQEEVEMFKQMNNAAFSKLKPMFLEHKKLQEKVAELEKAPSNLPPSYYEHPDSYIFHPDFANKQKIAQTAEAIEEYWREQLVLAEEGKDWRMLSWNEAKQAFEQSEPIAADGNAKARIIQYLQHANNQKQRVAGEFESFVKGHQEKAKGVRQYVKNLEDKYFSFYSDEVLKKPEMKPVNDMIQAAVKALPPELQGNIFTPFVAKSYALVMTLSQKINDLQEALEAKSRVDENAKLAGQPKDDSSGNGSGSKRAVTLEDFESAMR